MLFLKLNEKAISFAASLASLRLCVKGKQVFAETSNGASILILSGF